MKFRYPLNIEAKNLRNINLQEKNEKKNKPASIENNSLRMICIWLSQLTPFIDQQTESNRYIYLFHDNKPTYVFA